MYARHNITTKGIVLARSEASEGSVRVLFYTERLGLVPAFARSAREERSKLRAHLQTGTCGAFSLVKGDGAWRVTGATGTENIFFPLSRSAARAEAAARTLRAVGQFVRGAVADPRLWIVLAGFADAVREARADEAALLELLAVLRMLAALGYVRGDGAARGFLGVSYDPETLARAAQARGALVRIVNEAIAASGL